MTKQEVMNTMGAHVVSIGNQDQEYVYRQEFDKLLDAFMVVQSQRDEHCRASIPNEKDAAFIIEEEEIEIRALLTQADEKEVEK